MITKNIRDHYILFNDWTRIAITKAQSELYQSEIELKKYSDFIKIHDIDTDEILYNWRCSQIKNFWKNEKNEIKQTSCRCWYNELHPLISFPYNCICQKKYKCFDFQFVDKINELGYNINFYYEITNEMKEKYLENLKV